MSAGRADGDRSAAHRRSERDSTRRHRPMRYGTFLRITFFGSLLPGVGLIAAGRRRLGWFIFATFVALLAASVAVVIVVPTGKLASYGGDREALLYGAYALGALAALWLVLALVSHRSLEPRELSGGKRLVGALTVVAAASLVVSPMAIGARSALTQRDLIAAISASTSDKDEPESQTIPVTADKDDPWKDIPRVNVLLLGADVGKGRLAEGRGIRPDTQIVASIDTETGDTTLISLPRNLSQMPFPETSPLAEKYPNGFIDYETGSPTHANSMLNAVYNNVPALYPELELSGADANKLAVSGALGLDIHYYVMVNLDGFEAIIDALGGITITVTEDVPVDYGHSPDNPYCEVLAKHTIEPGVRELDGKLALQYARSRCNTDNYRRMERQQCVMRAIIDRADPVTLATRYQALAAATEKMVRTDIHADLFPAFIELAVDVKDGHIDTMNLDHDLFNEIGGSPGSPDYEALHDAVQQEIAPGDDTTDTRGEEYAFPDGSNGTSDPGGSGETGESDGSNATAGQTSNC